MEPGRHRTGDINARETAVAAALDSAGAADEQQVRERQGGRMREKSNNNMREEDEGLSLIHI